MPGPVICNCPMIPAGAPIPTDCCASPSASATASPAAHIIAASVPPTGAGDPMFLLFAVGIALMILGVIWLLWVAFGPAGKHAV
jgi:hypothetical protein